MSISAVRAIVHEIAPQMQAADREEIVSAALVKVCTCGAMKAVRYALADWLREQTEVPQPVDDVDLKRELQRARRSIRSASDEELAKWDAILSRMPEREREVAVRLAAGYSHRDIGAELAINHGTVTRVVARIRARFVDTCLWYPILDALYSLPNTKAERAEYVTDLSEYRPEPAAHHSTVFVVSQSDWELGIEPIRTTWFVPYHDRRPVPMKWYPGMPIRMWEPQGATGLWQHAFDLAHEPSHNLKFADRHAGKRSSEGDEPLETDLAPREVSGLDDGRRWFFEHPTHGTMISSPVIRREFSANGAFRSHVQ